MNTTIRVSSLVLRRPQFFDYLGPSPGMCRDLLLWAALSKKPIVKLSVPSFCRTFGYEQADLLRPCTPAEMVELRRSNLSDSLDVVSNAIGLALLRLASRAFIFPELHEGKKGYRSTATIGSIEVSTKKKSGPEVSYRLSDDILVGARHTYQPLNLTEYASLRTVSSVDKKGHPSEPDQAARRMYLHLSWKRHLWDSLDRADKLGEDNDPGKDDYRNLLEVAGLVGMADRAAPLARELASQLRRLLERVGAMPSIRLLPHLAPVDEKEEYEVSWMRLELDDSIIDRYCAVCHCEPGVVKAVAIRNTLKI